MPLADQHVAKWFEEMGYEQVIVQGLKAKTEDSVVNVTPEEQSDAFKHLNEAGVDALVQVGTSMASVGLAASVERELGKPVLAVNTACYWTALRAAGITDKCTGFGKLLEDH
jgi:maleate isomerase